MEDSRIEYKMDIYYRDESLRYLAKLKNISHQAMVKRKNKILELREFLSDF